MARIVLAMSGGVDSSVAAWLLKQQGHEVIGLFMRHGVAAEPVCATVDASSSVRSDASAEAAPGERTASSRAGCARTDAPARDASTALEVTSPPGQASHKKGCCTAADAQDARRVADRLEMPFFALNFDDAFGRIIDYFVAEYTAGRTPNPCIACNNWLKFGRLWEYAQSIGAERIATGHYAQLALADGDVQLRRGRDAGKDQSYVLFGIERSLLEHLAFPVGQYEKHEIRAMAEQLGLAVARKKDSQEICFIPDGDYAAFVRQRHSAANTAGEIVTTDGRVVGHHEGLEQFTVGQRRGLGVALGEPYYVVRLDHHRRQVVLGSRDELARRQLEADGANWLIDPPHRPRRCQAQIRYRARAAEAMLEPLDEQRFRVVFDEPQYSVAPGQAVVCYDGPRVLGGGWIRA